MFSVCASVKAGREFAKGGGRCWALTLLQLLLPAQDAGFVGFRFGFGDHTFFLVEDGEAGVGEDIVGVNGGNLLCDFDGFVKAI